MSTFRQKLETMSGEGVSTSDHENEYKTWIKDSVDEFLADVATQNSSLHGGLIVNSGDAEYASLVDLLPGDNARKASILKSGSLYIKNDHNGRGVCDQAGYKTKTNCEANGGTWDANRKFFVVNDGVIYKFVNVKQLNLFYHNVVKGASLKHLNHVQTSDPTSKRAAKITKMTTDKTADISVFAGDANANYTSNLLADPIRLEDAYQKKKVVS